jgi:hypothetical protein
MRERAVEAQWHRHSCLCGGVEAPLQGRSFNPPCNTKVYLEARREPLRHYF